jgi:soluble lytic murein transglycosylase-like protein
VLKRAANSPFAQQLQRLQQDKALPERSLGQVEAQLKMAQLQLWHGLFAAEEEATAETELFSLLAMTGNPEPSVSASRPAERFYAQAHPSLSGVEVSGRGEIEQLIERVAEKVSLAPELIRSVVAAESDFQPGAVSHAGAQGLMQLMPATAAELGVRDSFDPEQNLLGGSRYLKQLLDKYDGDLDKTLAAYNWGQGNVDRKGLQQMPRETRDYLAKVKGRLQG